MESVTFSSHENRGATFQYLLPHKSIQPIAASRLRLIFSFPPPLRSGGMRELHQAGQGIASVSAVDRGSYVIRNKTGEVPAEIARRRYVVA
jgi:hypothetical protein